MTDYNKAQIFSPASSNKLLVSGTGSIAVAALGGAGETFTVATIPHGHTDDELIYQVSATVTIAGTGDYITLPWRSPDGRVIQYAYLDDTNLYIVGISTSFAAPTSARTVNYSYRVLIP